MTHPGNWRRVLCWLRGWLWTIITLIWVIAMILVFAGGMFIGGRARARDLGQFPDSETSEWFRTLMMPDAPFRSCCGEADAYWCDDVHVREGRTYCRVTDDRDDGPLRRPHVAVGTEILIPDYKLKWDRGNPTGHAVVFLSAGGWVYCFVQSGGT